MTAEMPALAMLRMWAAPPFLAQFAAAMGACALWLPARSDPASLAMASVPHGVCLH